MLKQEIDSLVPSREFSRRGFVKTAVGSGFAAAVLPVTAQTIKTDSEGLTVGEVTIPVGDFKMPAYRAQPAGKTGLPVVLVSFGFTDRPAHELGGDVVIRVDDFPSEEVLDSLGIEDAFELTGLYTGLPIGSKSVDHSGTMPDMIHLYRRAILDEWVETDVSLEALVAHVVIHEIGHHFGLSDDEALKSVTLYPAQILGVADKLGSLEVGKLATLFVADGDPLEPTTRIERVFMQGREVELTDRQTALRDKYLKRQ